MGVITSVLAAALAGALTMSAADAGANQSRPGVEQARKKRAPRATLETWASWHSRHALYYQRNWGVDIIGVHPVSSGYMLRFNYRVIDPAKAQGLIDRTVKPFIVDEATRTALAVPAMENVGELRQVAPLQANRVYFVIFGNPGRLVKRGSRVTLVIGNLRAPGLVVE